VRWGRQKWLLVLVGQVTDRAVTYTQKSWSTVFRIWRKHMDRNVTNPDKLLKSQTRRGRRVLITHVCGWLWQVCYHKQNPGFYMSDKKVTRIPKLLPVIIKKTSFLWKGFIAEGSKESRTEVQEMYMALCAMYIILFQLYFIITPN